MDGSAGLVAVFYLQGVQSFCFDDQLFKILSNNIYFHGCCQIITLT